MGTDNAAKGNPIGAALVVGGGVGGMQAALDLAENGIMVYLVESRPSIGGVMPQLDKTFPTGDCSMCTLAPRLVEVGRHPNIELISYAEVKSFAGEPGKFKAIVRKKARYVDEKKCVGCGDCWGKCPQKKHGPPSEFDAGLVRRSAIYRPYPQAIPNVATLDRESCLYFQTGKCRICEKLCKAKAIDFDMKDEEITLDVGAAILAPGYEIFDARERQELGYGRFPNVVTALEFERFLSPSGPTGGEVVRPSDGEHPKKLAYIQCVGSRDEERNYCSSVCCMYATKGALVAKEHDPDLHATIFYIDIRAFGKSFGIYYERARRLGVRYVRCRPSSIKQVPGTKNLKIRYFAENGDILSEEFDMVVLSVGLRPPKDAGRLMEVFGVDSNEYGFCAVSAFSPVESSREGVFVCGTFSEPRDISETVTQASGAASKALGILSEARNTRLPAPREIPPELDVKGAAPRVGVFVCHCGTNIAGVVNVPEVVEYAQGLSDVVHAENFAYACSNDAMEAIKSSIQEHGLNRVVVASCTPRTHENLFRKTLPERGLNPFLFEMANIRDQCSWVHKEEPLLATRKAKDLVRMAVAKARLLEPLERQSIEVTGNALVIGGGVSGMAASLAIAAQGFDVHLVEKEPLLGGNFRRVSSLLGADDPRSKLKDMVEKVHRNDRISVYTGSFVSSLDGFVGNFKSTITGPNGQRELSHGAVVVATGAVEHSPKQYLYGESGLVATQLELEAILEDEQRVRGLKSVVMIQCVGSRTKDRPYCSRMCCAVAVKNALRIKEISPVTEVFVLYQDMRTYGFKEAYYKKAREKGVIFLRYEQEEEPSVVVGNGALSVSMRDLVLDMPVSIPADLLVLSAAIDPRPESKAVMEMLKLPIAPDGFFLEAHLKMRPVDFAVDGVFVCGLAHLPKLAQSCIAQAEAVGARVGAILSRKRIALDANISQVVDENCDGCAFCVDTCPFKAIHVLEYKFKGGIKKTVETNEAVCKGCGNCQATCPKKGIYVKGFTMDQLNAVIEAALVRETADVQTRATL